MTTSLFELCVPSYLQTLGAVAGILEKGLAHCKGTGIDPKEIVDSRDVLEKLSPDEVDRHAGRDMTFQLR